MSPEEIADRGRRARELLENDVLAGAFDTVRRECIEAWARTKMHDQVGRERHYMAVTLIDLVKDAIFGVVSKGEIAKAHLDAIEQEKNSERQKERRR